MPIPFRGAEEVDELGAAGFLLFLRDTAEISMGGGVLLVDARAEPLEFVHHSMTLPGGALWSAEDAGRHAGRRLAAELFRALGRTPGVLIVRDDGSASEQWLGDLEVGIPVGLLDEVNRGGSVAPRWLDGGPALGSPADRLCERLGQRDLLIEPFTRLERALRQLHPFLAEGDSD
ncbi:MAG: hypothetical protein GEU90_02865 [Gemmatimonas sp.]|nr:hypothetical protein [Gemmatimonas sp.]